MCALKLLAALALGLSLTVQSAEITKKIGKDSEGNPCTYSVQKMDHWEGQVAIFVNGSKGNFRIELHPESLPLTEGKQKPVYKDIKVKYKKGVLSSKHVERINLFSRDVTKVELAVDKSLRNPVSVKATAKTGPYVTESLDCKF